MLEVRIMGQKMKYFVYLPFSLDVSRRILGYGVSQVMDTALALNAL